MTDLNLPTFTPVKSSNILEVGYDPQPQSLFIKFKGGGLYRYNEVPQDVYDRMMDAPSVGKFVHGSIKGKFKSEKL